MALLLIPLVAKAIERSPERPKIAPQAPLEAVALVSTPKPLEWSPRGVQRLVEEEFGAQHVMVSIARAESRFDLTADNPTSTAFGVFQILIGTWKSYGCTGDRGNPHDNIACARKIFDRDGTVPWISSSYAWSAD